MGKIQIQGMPIIEPDLACGVDCGAEYDSVDTRHITEQWHNAITEAQTNIQTQLSEELESYLVFLLMRSIEQTNLGQKILAIDYLKSIQSNCHFKSTQLRDVGDHCLLLLGLFPDRIERLNLDVSYYVSLGQTAYHSIETKTSNTIKSLYYSLAREFIVLIDVLRAIRPQQLNWNLFELYELTKNDSSSHIRQILNRYNIDADFISTESLTNQ